jgi:hypothetical protein
MNSKSTSWMAVFVLAAMSIAGQSAVAGPQAASAPSDIPVVTGGSGNCTADFTVSDASGKGIYDAQIEIQIRYRFGGFHRLDAKVGTNSDGKARIEGLPEQIKKTAEFTVTHGDLSKTVPYDPETDCHAHHEVKLGDK